MWEYIFDILGIIAVLGTAFYFVYKAQSEYLKK